MRAMRPMMMGSMTTDVLSTVLLKVMGVERHLPAQVSETGMNEWVELL